MYYKDIDSLCKEFLEFIITDSFDSILIFKVEAFEGLLYQKTLDEIKSNVNIVELYAELVNSIEQIDNDKTDPEFAMFLGMLFGTFYKVLEEKGEKLL